MPGTEKQFQGTGSRGATLCLFHAPQQGPPLRIAWRQGIEVAKHRIDVAAPCALGARQLSVGERKCAEEGPTFSDGRHGVEEELPAAYAAGPRGRGVEKNVNVVDAPGDEIHSGGCGESPIDEVEGLQAAAGPGGVRHEA